MDDDHAADIARAFGNVPMEPIIDPLFVQDHKLVTIYKT